MPLPILLRGNHLSGGGGAAKSVVFDIADGWGSAVSVGIRSIDFYFEDEKITLTESDFTAYSTSNYGGNFLPKYTFITALSKTDSSSETSWASQNGSTTNQRLIIVFNDATNFDMIIVNNYVNAGGSTDVGCKNVKIYISTDEITSTVYGSAISNSTKVFDDQFAEHPANNYIADVIVYGSTTKFRSVVFDFANQWGDASYMGIRRIEFDLAGESFGLTTNFEAYTNSSYSAVYSQNFAFNTSLSKTGTQASVSWLTAAGVTTNSRITINFPIFRAFDGIIINNFHDSGIKTTRGVKNTKIYAGQNWCQYETGIIYNAALPTGHIKIFDSTIAQHVASNVVDNQDLSLTMGGL